MISWDKHKIKENQVALFAKYPVSLLLPSKTYWNQSISHHFHNATWNSNITKLCQSPTAAGATTKTRCPGWPQRRHRCSSVAKLRTSQKRVELESSLLARGFIDKYTWPNGLDLRTFFPTHDGKLEFHLFREHSNGDFIGPNLLSTQCFPPIVRINSIRLGRAGTGYKCSKSLSVCRR